MLEKTNHPENLKNLFTDKDIQRYHSRYSRLGDDDCWLWNYVEGHAGHGRMWAGGRNTQATHIALWLDGRPRPDNLFALHSCDNPRCVNPKHLRWGTQQENVHDREIRGRTARNIGSSNSAAKLNEVQVLAIRQDTRTREELARIYSTTKQNIRLIQTRKTWRHVDGLDSQKGRKTNLSKMQPHTKKEEGAMFISHSKQ